MFTIRDFTRTDQDYELINDIDSTLFPEYARTVDEWRHMDETHDPKYPFHRDLIELNDQVIAFGEYGQSHWQFHPKKFFFYVFVHPAHEHPDVRDVYFEHIMQRLADRDLIAITSGMLEDKTTHVEYLVNNGFVETMREPLSKLDLTTFDESRFAAVLGEVREAGIQIVNVEDLRETDSDWKHKLHELDWAIMQDVPSPDPIKKTTFEYFENHVLADPNFLPEGYFVALDRDDFVGQSVLMVSQADNEKYMTGLTGVLPNHRRKGIATALKLKAIAYARQQGIKVIETGNEENNPMYQINLKLGFKPQPAWVEYEKVLHTIDSGA